MTGSSATVGILKVISHDWVVGYCLLQGVSTCGQRKKKLPPSRIETIEVSTARLDHQRMLWDRLITAGPSVDAVGLSDHSWTISGCCGTV